MKEVLKEEGAPLWHVDAYFDLMENLGKKKARKLHEMIDFSSGKPRLKSIIINIIDEREARKILRTLKKYEFYRKRIIKALQSVIDELS